MIYFSLSYKNSPCVCFSEKLKGVMIGTSAPQGNRAGKEQYRFYCAYAEQPSRYDRLTSLFSFWNWFKDVEKKGYYQILHDELWVSFDVFVLDAATPIILSIDDIDHHRMYLNNLENNPHSSELWYKSTSYLSFCKLIYPKKPGNFLPINNS